MYYKQHNSFNHCRENMSLLTLINLCILFATTVTAILTSEKYRVHDNKESDAGALTSVPVRSRIQCAVRCLAEESCDLATMAGNTCSFISAPDGVVLKDNENTVAFVKKKSVVKFGEYAAQIYWLYSAHVIKCKCMR